ncbi:MAG: hypothetical protein PHW60_12975 [Kiritimatiellae bacterium]|nr:hypothetical protein [Kiritimatiellia bacterium]
MKMLYILMIGFVTENMAMAQATNTETRTFATPAIFSRIVQSNGVIVVTSPDTQTRFLAFLNSTNIGFADLGRDFVLRSGDTLDLAEKHTTIKAEAAITKTEARLTVTKVHDARSFGYGVTTNVVVLTEKRK